MRMDGRRCSAGVAGGGLMWEESVSWIGPPSVRLLDSFDPPLSSSYLHWSHQFEFLFYPESIYSAQFKYVVGFCLRIMRSSGHIGGNEAV